MDSIVPSDFRKVTYETHKYGRMGQITAHLPAGFTMRQYTRMFNLDNAADYKMTEEDYLKWQVKLLGEDLLTRIPQEKWKLLQ